MDIKELLKYAIGYNYDLTEKEIISRLNKYKKNKIFKGFSDESLIKFAMQYRENEIPPEILEVLNEYGRDLILENIGLKDFYFEMIYKRMFEIYPNEGLIYLKDFFTNFKNEFETIKNDISEKRKKEKFGGLICFLTQLNETKYNDIINLELDKHRPYINDYINTIQKEIDKLNNVKNEESLSFNCNLSDEQLKQLYSELHGKYIASDTSLDRFTAIFRARPINTIVPVKWIKKATRNKTTCKKALLELLHLINIPNSEIEDKEKLKLCFADGDNKPLNYTGSNFYNNKDNKNSEFFLELQGIVKSL